MFFSNFCSLVSYILLQMRNISSRPCKDSRAMESTSTPSARKTSQTTTTALTPPPSLLQQQKLLLQRFKDIAQLQRVHRDEDYWNGSQLDYGLVLRYSFYERRRGFFWWRCFPLLSFTQWYILCSWFSFDGLVSLSSLCSIADIKLTVVNG